MSTSQSFDFDEIQETEEERKARENRLHAAEIRRFLKEIDARRIRPLAAIVAGVGTDYDREKLADLEEQAQVLRAELEALEARVAALEGK